MRNSNYDSLDYKPMDLRLVSTFLWVYERTFWACSIYAHFAFINNNNLIVLMNLDHGSSYLKKFKFSMKFYIKVDRYLWIGLRTYFNGISYKIERHLNNSFKPFNIVDQIASEKSEFSTFSYTPFKHVLIPFIALSGHSVDCNI